MTATSTHEGTEPLDLIVIGAGFAGLYMTYKARSQGFTVLGLERGRGVGGVWYWNRYPGARCDVESAWYSYSFDKDLEQEWSWKERYPAQPEILSYLEHVATRFGLYDMYRFSALVQSAHWDDGAKVWEVTYSERGVTTHVTSRFVVFATGNLSEPLEPLFPNQEAFEGRILKTSSWPHEEVDFSGRRVAVVGTGSSGVQTITAIADQCDELYVLQRTPNFSIPLDSTKPNWEDIKKDYEFYRNRARYSPTGLPLDGGTKSALEVDAATRQEMYESNWQAGGFGLRITFNDLLTDADSNQTLEDFVSDKVRSIVHDQALAQKLIPTNHPIMTKRVCMDNGYFDVWNRDNIHLIDLREDPITGFYPRGIKVGDREFEVDDVVLATGYDAMTGALRKIDIRTADGALRDAWNDGPKTYLGVMVSGFPNMFMITGPGSPSVISNMVTSIEQHVDLVADVIRLMRAHDVAKLDVSEAAQEQWMRHVNIVATGTLYGRADSWYVGANTPGKPRVFMPYVGGVGRFRRICERIVEEGYFGFTFDDRPLGTQGDTTIDEIVTNTE